MPRVEGEELFKIGVSNESGTVESGFPQTAESAYWEEADGYVYYRNKKTGNKLLNGVETPPIFIQKQASKDAEAEQSGEYAMCEPVLLAEATGAGETEQKAWQRAKIENTR